MIIRVIALTALVIASIGSMAPARASAEMPDIIDLARYFPHAQMARTHYLHGSQVNTNWYLTDIGGEYFAFRLGDQLGSRGDLYVVFETNIVLLGHTWTTPSGGVGVIQYFPPYPSFPRYLDTRLLPFTRESPAATFMHQEDDGPVTIGTMPAIQMNGSIETTMIDGNLIRLHWGDDVHYETLWIGSVPVTDTGLAAPGIRRYKTHIGGGVDTEFSWSPR